MAFSKHLQLPAYFGKHSAFVSPNVLSAENRKQNELSYLELFQNRVYKSEVTKFAIIPSGLKRNTYAKLYT